MGAVDLQPSSIAVQPAEPDGGAFAKSAGIPSLDAVDRALEELQQGLAEIDSTLGRTPAVGVGSVSMRRPAVLYPHEVCKCGATFASDSVVCHSCGARREASGN